MVESPHLLPQTPTFPDMIAGMPAMAGPPKRRVALRTAVFPTLEDRNMRKALNVTRGSVELMLIKTV